MSPNSEVINRKLLESVRVNEYLQTTVTRRKNIHKILIIILLEIHEHRPPVM